MMEITKQERMTLLLEQAKMPEEFVDTYFKESLLMRLEVFKKKKQWHFHIQVKNVLPLTIYQTLFSKLQEAFKEIATIELTIYADNQQCDSNIVCDYWSNFLQSISNLSPAYKDLIYNQTHKFNHDKIMLTARNEAEASALKRRLEDKFKVYCKKVGLPTYSLDIEVNTESLNLEQFREQKALEDQKIVLQTIRDKEKRDKQADNELKPFMIGYKIQDEPMQMEEIQEEERRVTVQGYVFSIDIRELRSGRSLLIINATDYTDSFQIIMF